MKTIKLGPECLTTDYKMLTDEAKQKIFDISANAKEKTTIELPKGLLFLNITDDDCPKDFEWNEDVLVKIPATLIGYNWSNILESYLKIPSFMAETNFASDMASDNQYESKVPKRKFAISGCAHGGYELSYKSVDDEDEANEVASNGEIDCDMFFAAIPFSDEAEDNQQWTLEIEGLKLELCTDDHESGVYFKLGGKSFKLICHTSYAFTFEESVNNSAVVQKMHVKHNSREADFKELGNYDPSQLKVYGSWSLGLWAMHYGDTAISWTSGGDGEEEGVFYYDGDDYNSLDVESDDWAFDDESESGDNDDSNDGDSATSDEDDIKLNTDGMVAKDLDHLESIVRKALETLGPECDLNFIDVSNVTDMNSLFSWSPFHGDISKWNVSSVTDMSCMFMGSAFDGNISSWDVSNVTDFSNMFDRAKNFNINLNTWNVSKSANTDDMFNSTPLEAEGKLPKWYKK